MIAAASISSCLNIFRSVFHASLFLTGLVYAFLQPAFLNTEVWIFIYSLAGMALICDSYIFVFQKQFKAGSVKAWSVIYFFDALFVALIMYRTGYVFFWFLSFVWLVHILFAGLQFQYRGSLLQGFLTSCLFTWVHFISPHFASVDGVFFAFNNFIFLLMAFCSGLMGVYFYPLISSFRRLYWNVRNSLTHPLCRFRWDMCLEDADRPGFRQEKLNINELVREVVEYVHSKTDFHFIQCELSNVSVIFGYKNKLKQVMIGLIHWFFHTYSSFHKLKITTYNDKIWTVIQLEKSGVAQVREPLQFFSWLKGFSVIQKVIDEHGGRIEVSNQTNSLSIKFPNGNEKTQAG